MDRYEASHRIHFGPAGAGCEFQHRGKLDGTTGGVAAAATVFIDYNWGAPTRSVAGRIAGLEPNGQVWIDFWHQSVAAV